MPNWCFNRVFLRHRDPALLRRVLGAHDERKLRSVFLPGTAGPEIGLETGAPPGEIRGTTLELCFDTPWDPPNDLYVRLEELGLAVDAFFVEPGMAFCGRRLDGKEQRHDLPSDPAECERTVPQEIRDALDLIGCWCDPPEREGKTSPTTS